MKVLEPREEHSTPLISLYRSSSLKSIAASTPIEAAVSWGFRFLLLALLANSVVAISRQTVGLTFSINGEGDPFRQAVYLTLLLGTALSVGLTSPRSFFALPLPVAASLTWCAISTSWAIEPSISARRLALTAMITWMIFVLVRVLGSRSSLATLTFGLVCILLGNWGWTAISPTSVHYQLDASDPNLLGAWRGLSGHKNDAGPVAAIALIVFWFAPSNYMRMASRILLLLLSAIFLWFTHSKTSIAVVIFAITGGESFRHLPRKLRLMLLPALLILLAALIFYLSLKGDALVASLYDNATLTGRGRIWQMLLTYISDNFWLGAGYGSFWNIGDFSPVNHYGSGWVSTGIVSGHNGYLDLGVTIGVPGALLTAYALLIWPIIKLLSSSNIDLRLGSAMISVLLFCLFHNISESTLLDRDTPVQVLLLFAVAIGLAECTGNQLGGNRQRLITTNGRGRGSSIV